MTKHYMFTIAIKNPDTMSDAEVEQFKEICTCKVTALFKPTFCNKVVVKTAIISDEQFAMLEKE